MAFTSPYGIGYGLGAIGSGVTQGLLRGQEMAPQLRYENLRNQMLQTQLGNEQAQQQVFSQVNPNQIQPGQQTTPLDQPVSDLQYQIQQLRQRGQGIAANQLEQNFVQLQQKQHSMAIGRAAQELLYGDPNNAKAILNNMGFNIDSVQQDPNGNFQISAGGQVHTLSPDQISMIAADPSQLPNIFYRNQLLGLRGQAIQQRENASWLNYQAKLQQQAEQERVAYIRGGYQVKAAGLRASGQTGAATIYAQGALKRMQMRPDVAAVQFMTDHDAGLGMNPSEAYLALQQAKDAPKSIDQIVQNAQKAHPEWQANDVEQFRQSLTDASKQRGQAAPPQPAPKAAATPRVAPLPQDRTLLRKGVVYATPKGNLRFNGTGFDPI